MRRHSSDQYDIMAYLIEKKADVNAQYNNFVGQIVTALKICVNNGNGIY